jgi:hypothetical protein
LEFTGSYIHIKCRNYMAKAALDRKKAFSLAYLTEI